MFLFEKDFKHFFVALEDVFPDTESFVKEWPTI